jgi:acyl-CoA synthetase (AMP-forming)/AMP-acid ligase II
LSIVLFLRSEVLPIGRRYPGIAPGQLIVGFVVLDAATSVAPEDILRYVGKRLVAYKVPERLLIVDHIPRNGMGKAICPACRSR